MTKDRQREIRLDAALAAVSFKLDGNFGEKKEKKKKCRAFMKNIFCLYHNLPSLNLTVNVLNTNVCVCVFENMFSAHVFNVSLYLCSLTCRRLEEKQTLHRVAV